MTRTLSEQLNHLGIQLPPVPTPVAAYIPAIVYEGLVQTAGQIPIQAGKIRAVGLVPTQVSTEHAAECARICVLNALAAAAQAAGGLDNIERPLKVTCFVAATPEYTDHPKVADGASKLLHEIFGEAGTHARAAVGCSSLPRGVPVEVDVLFKVRNAPANGR